MKKQLLTIIPKNFASWLTGSISRVRAPQYLLKTFINTFGINMSEAEFEVSHYQSIEDVFTRRLKKNQRPLQGDICMPCDGTMQWNGSVCPESELTAKDLTYSIQELIYGTNPQNTNPIDPAFAQVIYLAPHNYHRVHTPTHGTLKKIRHIPGPLWPVSPDFVEKRPALLAENERMVFEIEVDEYGSKAWIVMVGAYNVGRIRPAIDPHFLSNKSPRKQSVIVEQEYNHTLKKGDELGTFMLGSTTVTIFNKIFCETYSVRTYPSEQSVQLGEALADKTTKD
ncbi:MAG: archaetidylserine decarboxylase [Oligoflexales bacterium]